MIILQIIAYGSLAILGILRMKDESQYKGGRKRD